MGLDIRWPIGLMFSLVGILLLVSSFIIGPDELKRSLDININLWWGVILLVFGGLMVLFAWRSGQQPPASAPKS